LGQRERDDAKSKNIKLNDIIFRFQPPSPQRMILVYASDDDELNGDGFVI
jgi:hypothetical protein